MPAIFSAIVAIGGVIFRFGRFLLPLMGRLWPLLTRLFAFLAGSWSRVLAFIVLPLSIGGCEASLFASQLGTFKDAALGTRAFLFAKITANFPAWVQNIGAFVNSVFPLDTLFTAIGMIITFELAFIAFRLAGMILRKGITKG